MHMTFTLRQLETFVWVATLGNFRKTAEHLNTTQPTISTRIAGLEDLLRVKLFERDTGSVRLTSKGQELLPYAEKVLRMADMFRERTATDSALSGVLRLGVSETIVHTLLPTFLSELHDRHPNIDVEITVDATINLRNDLVSRNLDLAFLMGPVSEYRIGNIDLASFPLVWTVSPRLGIDIRRPLKINELVKYPILTYARITRPHAEIETYLRANCELPARIFPSSSLAACLQMTCDGIGIGTLPRIVVEDRLADGSLVAVSCEWKPSDLDFTASFPTVPPNPISDAAAELAREISVRRKRLVKHVNP